MSGQRPIAVVDIDGVLADVRHRLHHVSGHRRDWDAFFAGIPDDPPLPEGLAAVAELAAGHELIYLTGRPERTRAHTVEWMNRHGLPPGRLVMRADGDRRPARVTKPRLLRAVAPPDRVAVVVDDDEAVCAALEATGWPVRRATWTPQSASLARAQEQDGRT